MPDPYVPRDSLVHGLDSRIKLVLALTLILAAALTPSGAWPVYLILGALVVALGIAAELPAAVFWRRAWPVLLIGGAALPLLWTTPGNPWGRGPMGITDAGAVRVISLLLKAWLAVVSAAILTATTPFPALLGALRALRLPRLLVAVIGLMWRYLFVLGEEAARLRIARDSRSAAGIGAGRRPGRGWLWRARVTGGMVGNLFVRAYGRAERIYDAMLARGYDGEIRVLALPPLSWGERAWTGFGVAGLILLALGGLLGWG